MADDDQGGANYTFTPVLGANADEAAVYDSNPNWQEPPPVTSAEINQQTTNAINTQIQPVLPSEPPTGAQVLNNAVPPPTAPPPVTNEQILGQGIQDSPTPPPISTNDFKQNVNQNSGAAPPDPSLNGDSNISGGPATGAPSNNSNAGGRPGTGTSAQSPLAPGANNPINTILGAFGNGRTPFNQIVNYAEDFIQPKTKQATSENPAVNQNDAQGRRVRLRAKPGGINFVYGSSPLLAPIKATNGMVWPYQPTITYNQEVDYKSMELTHTNQDIYAYHRTPSLRLTVDGEFSVQNQQEGIYGMACIHFLRVVTKMNFGSTDKYKGTPPPVLLFDAYGQYMFSQIPVIVTGFTVGLPKDVDYVPIDMGSSGQSGSTVADWRDLNNNYLSSRSQGNIVWLPAVFNIQVQLTVQNSPTKLRAFNLNEFRNGTLLKQGGWV